MKRIKKLLSILFVFSYLALTPAFAATTVRIGVQPATQPIYIARAAGLLKPIEEKHDVTFEFFSFSYGAPENQALAAGELDLASAGMGPAIVAAARLPAKLLAITILEQTAIIVPASSDIKSVADLEGKKIAFPGKGSQQYPLLVKALSDAGLSIDDVELFKTKGSDVTQLVSQADVDAGITWDPHVSKALSSGGAKVLMKAEDILPLKAGHYIGNGFYGRTEFIEENPELVGDIVSALVEAVTMIVDDPKSAIGMWSTEIGFPVDVLEFSLGEGISVYDPDIVPDEETITQYTSFLKEAEILESDDAPKTDASFAINAMK